MPSRAFSELTLTVDDQNLRSALARARVYTKLHLPLRWLARVIGSPSMDVLNGSTRIGSVDFSPEWRDDALWLVDQFGGGVEIGRKGK